MPAQGRKNVHGKTGVRFKQAYTKSKFDNMVRNVVTELIVHEHVTVTASVEQAVITEISRLIGLTRKEDVVSAKRAAASFLRPVYVDDDKKVTALDKLFTVIGPRYKDVNGGYVVTYKVEERRGDNAPQTLIAFKK